jgi:hypothetical protein
MGMLVALAMLTLPAGAATTSSDVFDKPLDKLVVKLPADHDNLQAKPNRSCSYYSGFMVKEVDLGEVGADELSITPIAKGGPKPSCEAKTAGEIIIKADDWSGYFEGAKGDFVFFTAGDGVNGGMPYAVYSAKTSKKLFEDSASTELFRSIQLSNNGMILRYTRVFLAPCSLYADATGCWAKIKAATSISRADAPDCRNDYEKEMKRTPQFAKAIAAGRSVIGYNVEAHYAGGKLTFTPKAGPIACWLED